MKISWPLNIFAMMMMMVVVDVPPVWPRLLQIGSSGWWFLTETEGGRCRHPTPRNYTVRSPYHGSLLVVFLSPLPDRAVEGCCSAAEGSSESWDEGDTSAVFSRRSNPMACEHGITVPAATTWLRAVQSFLGLSVSWRRDVETTVLSAVTARLMKILHRLKVDHDG